MMIKIKIIFGLFLYLNKINFNNCQILDRLINAEEARPHQFPFQIFLDGMINNKEFTCGGSLISNQWILTAAHCVDKIDAGVVLLGAHNLFSGRNNKNLVRIRITKKYIFVHPGWDPENVKNDIALIKLPQKVKFNDKINAVSLPRRIQTTENFVGNAVVASGWGRYSDTNSNLSPTLKFIEVTVLPNWICNIRYLGVIQPSNICTKADNFQSICNGDSGGPLVYEEKDGSYTVIGISSFVFAYGCEYGWPSVFTRVTSHLEWIHFTTGIPIKN